MQIPTATVASVAPMASVWDNRGKAVKRGRIAYRVPATRAFVQEDLVSLVLGMKGAFRVFARYPAKQGRDSVRIHLEAFAARRRSNVARSAAAAIVPPFATTVVRRPALGLAQLGGHARQVPIVARTIA